MVANIILTVILVVVGGAFLASGMYQYRVAWIARKRWAITQGVVQASGLDAFDGMNRRSKVTPRYVLQVHYEYQVGGQKFEGKQVGFGGASYGLQAGMEKLRQYPQGVLVTVHYDPSNPANAVLETNPAGMGFYFLLGFVILFLGVAAVWMLPQ